MEAPTQPPESTGTAPIPLLPPTISVTVTIKDDVITGVSASSGAGGREFFGKAQGPVIPAIVSRQSTSVDTVSRATYRSKSIMQAAASALAQAKN